MHANCTNREPATLVSDVLQVLCDREGLNDKAIGFACGCSKSTGLRLRSGLSPMSLEEWNRFLRRAPRPAANELMLAGLRGVPVRVEWDETAQDAERMDYDRDGDTDYDDAEGWTIEALNNDTLKLLRKRIEKGRMPGYQVQECIAAINQKIQFLRDARTILQMAERQT